MEKMMKLRKNKDGKYDLLNEGPDKRAEKLNDKDMSELYPNIYYIWKKLNNKIKAMDSNDYVYLFVSMLDNSAISLLSKYGKVLSIEADKNQVMISFYAK